MDSYSCLFPHAHMNHEISDISQSPDNHTSAPETISWEVYGSTWENSETNAWFISATNEYLGNLPFANICIMRGAWLKPL